MQNPVIQVDRVGKQYVVGRRARTTTLREAVQATFTAPFRRLRHLSGEVAEEEKFWALRDVSFDIAEGEIVGIIGRNGAGKSTLLKVLSRITAPTTGRIEIRGRVASLLEVGTGFHPELTGRENVQLSGAILGMTNAEIAQKFDQIVDFAGVERFLDMPVKRYSSGMYVRLAFAVAAHLDPEILIVDEVLAVGDAQFQKKCLGKMGSVARGGRTVLLVSHNMATVENLCAKTVLLDQGRLIGFGGTDEIIGEYMKIAGQSAANDIETRQDRSGNGRLRIVGFQALGGSDEQVVRCGDSVRLVVAFENKDAAPLRHIGIDLGIDNDRGHRIATLSSELCGADFEEFAGRNGSIEIAIDELNLSPGAYMVTLFCKENGQVADWVRSAGTIHVESADFYGTGKLPGVGDILLKYRMNLAEARADGQHAL